MTETDPQNPLGLRNITDKSESQIIANFRNSLTLDWVFDKWYEKAFLVILLLWSIYNLWKVIF